MTPGSNLEKLKAGYKAWHESKGLDTRPWLELMDDQIRISSVGAQAPGMTFAARHKAAEYLGAITQEWKMVHWTCETFVCEGERIAMFGRCAWTHKTTGKTAEVNIAHLWLFKGGKAVEYTEIFDSARAASAATP